MWIDYDNFDNSSDWMSGSNDHNGDMRGGSRSPYEISNWGGGNDRRNSNGMHCVHMRGLPFKASQMDIVEVCKCFHRACCLNAN